MPCKVNIIVYQNRRYVYFFPYHCWHVTFSEKTMVIIITVGAWHHKMLSTNSHEFNLHQWIKLYILLHIKWAFVRGETWHQYLSRNNEWNTRYVEILTISSGIATSCGYCENSSWIYVMLPCLLPIVVTNGRWVILSHCMIYVPCGLYGALCWIWGCVITYCIVCFSVNTINVPCRQTIYQINLFVLTVPIPASTNQLCNRFQ